MPGLKDVIAVFFRVGESEAVFMGVLEKPFVSWSAAKAFEAATEVIGSEIKCGTELVLWVTLVGRESIGTVAKGGGLVTFELGLGIKGAVGWNHP